MIEAWIDGRNFGNKGSGLAIRLQSGKYDWVRAIPAGSITTNQAELKALEFALKSIRIEFLADEILVRSSNRYAQMMLEKIGNDWAKKASTNVELVNEIRDLYSEFENIRLISDPDNDVMGMLKKVNETCVKKGTSVFDRK
jgi:ribonuclease HI